MSDGNRVATRRSTPAHHRLRGGTLALSVTTLSLAIATFYSIAGSHASLLPGSTSHVSAQTTASAISQEFQSDQRDITIGALVSINKDATGKVSLTSTENIDDLVGIVANSSLLQIGDAANSTTTPVILQVVTEGVVDALVSDINGDIKVGDKITASPVRGVGMRLTGNAQIVGISQGKFSESETTTREITSNDGSKTSIKIGRIPVRVSIGYYSGNPTDEGTGNPDTPLIQRLANAIAGRETSTVRIAISFSLLIMGFVVMVVLLRTAVASSLTSIGRNPLSAEAIHKNFYAVAFIALGILLVALATSYLALIV